MLCLVVIDRNHRIFQRFVAHHSLQPDDSRSCLLTAADYVLDQLKMVLVDLRDEITPIINRYIRLEIDYIRQVPVIVFLVLPFVRPYLDSFLGQCRSDIILSAERIASCYGDIRSSSYECADKYASLFSDVQCHPDTEAFEGLLFRKALSDFEQCSHL